MNNFEAYVHVGQRHGITIEVKSGDTILIQTMGTGMYESLSLNELDVFINTLMVARDVMRTKDDLTRTAKT